MLFKKSNVTSDTIPKAITNFFKKKQSMESLTVDIESINAGNRAARAAQRVGMGINAITAARNAASLAATVWSTKRDQDNVEVIAAASGRAAAKSLENAIKLEYNIQPIPNEVMGDISTFTSHASFNRLDRLLMELDNLNKQSKMYKDSKDTKRFKQVQDQIEQIRYDIDYVTNDEIIAAQKKSKQDPRTSLSWAKHYKFPLNERKAARSAAIALDEAKKVLASYRMKNPLDTKEIKRKTNIVKEAEQRVIYTDDKLKREMKIAQTVNIDKAAQFYKEEALRVNALNDNAAITRDNDEVPPSDKDIDEVPQSNNIQVQRVNDDVLETIADAAASKASAAEKRMLKIKWANWSEKATYGAEAAAAAAANARVMKEAAAEKRMELAILNEIATAADETTAANNKIAMDKKRAADAGEAEANRVSKLTMEQAKVEQLELERKDDIIARKLMANNAVSEAIMEEDKAIKIEQKAIKSKQILEQEIKETFSQIKRQKLISEKERAGTTKNIASTIIFNWNSAYLAWENVVKKITELDIRELDIITPEDDKILVELEQFASDKTNLAMEIIDDRIKYIKTNYDVLLPDVKQELDSLESSWKTANERKIEEISARIKDLNLRNKLGPLNLQETNELERLKVNARKLNVPNMLSQIPQESLYESNGGAQRHKKYTRKNKKRTRKHKKNKGKKTRAHRITRYKH